MGWLGITLVLMCLPLHAQSVYKVNVPHAGPDSRLEISVGGWNGNAAPGKAISVKAGEWEVTVEYDAVNCLVYCSYRRLRDVVLLSPPVTTIRFYPDGGSRARVAVVDPAGVGFPRASGRAVLSYEQVCAGGARMLPAGLVAVGVRVESVGVRVLAVAVGGLGDRVTASLPLRI